jgi:hypothetical protein
VSGVSDALRRRLLQRDRPAFGPASTPDVFEDELLTFAAPFIAKEELAAPGRKVDGQDRLRDSSG